MLLKQIPVNSDAAIQMTDLMPCVGWSSSSTTSQAVYLWVTHFPLSPNNQHLINFVLILNF